MVIIIPIGHEQLTVSRLPFATIGLIAICIVVHLLTSSAIEADLEAESSTLFRIYAKLTADDTLVVSDQVAATLPRSDREHYDQLQEWRHWYETEPREVAAYFEEIGVDPEAPLHPTVGREPRGSIESAFDPSAPAPEITDPEELKRDFIVRLNAADPVRAAATQREMDILCDEYAETVRGSSARRFAYVPADPSAIGLLTHMLLHGGIIHLLFNMLFLWVIGAKLEDLWTKPVFLGVFVACGIAGALAHQVTHPASEIPLVGASGAVAGLMGAFAVRLSRTQIQFAYAYILLLKPKFGTFDAPAYVMLPLWFAGELASALFLDLGFVAYWAHVGGFLLGTGIAVGFKLFHFEERVLGRIPERQTVAEETPLVAFQRTGQPKLTPIEDPVSAAPVGIRFDFRELTIVSIDAAGFHCLGSDQQPVLLAPTPDAVRGIAAARVDRLDEPLATECFTSGQFPAEPALLIALAGPPRAPDGPTAAYLIDGSKLRYQQLMSAPRPTPRENLAALAQLLRRVYPHAAYAGDQERLARGELELCGDLDELVARLRRAVGS